MKKSVFAALSAALFSLAACSGAQILNATIPTSGLEITHDVVYGPAPREKLDIYRPAGKTSLPVIVFIYGGSWNSGSKEMYPFVAATLARRGNVVVAPDYRLYPQVQYPVFLQDCARAVAWTAHNLPAIGGDPKRVFVMGHSAGAYNALMLAINPVYLQAEGTSPAVLAGAIGLAGPYDFLPIIDPEVKAVFAPGGDGPQTQPITYVTGKEPPMLLLSGDKDTTVMPRNSTALAARVVAMGGKAAVKIYPGVDHIGLITAIAPLFQNRAPVVGDIEAFVGAVR